MVSFRLPLTQRLSMQHKRSQDSHATTDRYRAGLPKRWPGIHWNEPGFGFPAHLTAALKSVFVSPDTPAVTVTKRQWSDGHLNETMYTNHGRFLKNGHESENPRGGHRVRTSLTAQFRAPSVDPKLEKPQLVVMSSDVEFDILCGRTLPALGRARRIVERVAEPVAGTSQSQSAKQAQAHGRLYLPAVAATSNSPTPGANSSADLSQ
jgi:hypothetical protein